MHCVSSDTTISLMDDNLRIYLARRLKRPLSSQELADALGVSLATVKRRSTTDDIIKAARFFGFPPVEVLVALNRLAPADAGRTDLGFYTHEELLAEILRRLTLPTAGSPDGPTVTNPTD